MPISKTHYCCRPNRQAITCTSYLAASGVARHPYTGRYAWLILLACLLFSSFSQGQSQSELQDELASALFPYAFTEQSDSFVELFVGLLGSKKYGEAFSLFDPDAESYSAEEFAAMNHHFQDKIGSWRRHEKIGTTFREVYDRASDTSLQLPAYLYRIDLESFSTPLLLVLFMDGSSPRPSILGYDFMPKETIEAKGFLRLWRNASKS